MAEQSVEAVLAEFARSREEHLGHVIGMAAVLACIPGANRIDANAVRGVIDEFMAQFVGAKSDTRTAARRIADKVLALARQMQGTAHAP
jgi:hypothetical protein